MKLHKTTIYHTNHTKIKIEFQTKNVRSHILTAFKHNYTHFSTKRITIMYLFLSFNF